MVDREKVIKDAENYEPYAQVFANLTVRGELFRNMLVLLKEQEAVKPILKREGKNKIYNDYVCPICDNEVVYEQNYCSECGRPFLWEGR